MPTPNRTLMINVLAHIDIHPETFEQKSWRCATGMCFAGTSGDLSPQWKWKITPTSIEDYDDENITMGWLDLPGFTPEAVPVDYAATYLLGIDADQATYLFAASNNLVDIYIVAARILKMSLPNLRQAVQARVVELLGEERDARLHAENVRMVEAYTEHPEWGISSGLSAEDSQEIRSNAADDGMISVTVL